MGTIQGHNGREVEEGESELVDPELRTPPGGASCRVVPTVPSSANLEIREDVVAAPPRAPEVQEEATSSSEGPSGIPLAAEGSAPTTLHWTSTDPALVVEKPSTPAGSAAPKGSDDLRGPSAAQPEVPEMFLCPISMQLMRDPVLLPTGQTFERQEIGLWLKDGNLKCPMTGLQMTPPICLVPNLALRHSIEHWCSVSQPHLLDRDGKLLPLPGKESTESFIEVGPEGVSIIGSPRQAAAPDRAVVTATPQRRCKIGWFVPVVMTVLSCVLCAELVANGWVPASVRVNPHLGPSPQTLLLMGAKSTVLILEKNQWMRVVSAAFLSAGIVQFAGVIIVLFTYGPRIVEDSSPLCAVAIYFIAAIGGVLTSAIMSPDTIAVASSAGAFGLLGATWVDYTIYFRGTAAVALLVAITCANVFVGLMPFVDNWCHISAFCLGSLLWSSFLANRFVNEGAVGTWGMSLKFAQVMALIGAHAIIVLLVLVLVFDVPVSKYITWAKSVSCLDMSWWDCSLASNNFALAQGTYSLAPEMAAAAGTAAPAFAGQPSSKYSSQPMRSARCCNELEFLYWTSPYRPGSPDVCGGSMVPVCYYSENFFQSKEHCQNVGSRHCTLEELQARETFSSGCGMDNKWVWTSTPCKARGQVGHYVARGGDGMRKECVANWELYDTRCCADAC